MSRGKVAPASPRPSTSDDLGQSSPPSSRFPSSTIAKPLSLQTEEEALNRPTTPIEEEVIDPLDLSCSVHDSFFVNLNNKEKLPFHVKEYNVLQAYIISKLSRHIYHPLISAYFSFPSLRHWVYGQRQCFSFLATLTTKSLSWLSFSLSQRFVRRYKGAYTCADSCSFYLPN